MLRKIIALLKKDLIMETSYKLAFALNLFSVAASIITYFFIDKLFGHSITPHLEEFGVNYFSYVLISMAFFSYIGVGIGSFASRIRSEQMQGTLESLLLTPTKLRVLLSSMVLWNLIFATLDVLIYLGIGFFLFHIDFSSANILSAIVVLLLTITCFCSLGIISASFIITFKKGNPVGWLINTLEGLLGGVYFPISVMPDFLQIVAKFLPITYAIRAMEFAIYQGYSLGQLKKELLFLLFFSLLLAPLSICLFNNALRKSRYSGSLIQY